MSVLDSLLCALDPAYAWVCKQHPDKTFIGRIERGFDFLGYYFCRGPLRLAQRTLQNHATRLHRLYEQQKEATEGAARLDEYVTRWQRWCRAGLWMLDQGGLPLPGTCAGDTKGHCQGDCQ